jgi:hypothetical protein
MGIYERHFEVICVFDSQIVALPHIWGTDELKRKFPDGVFASEAVSCWEEIALQSQNHQIRGSAHFSVIVNSHMNSLIKGKSLL